MLRRTEQKRRLEEALASASGPKSTSSKLSLALSKLPSDKKAGLDEDPTELLNRIRAAKACVKTLYDQCDATKPSTIDQFTAQVDEKLMDLKRCIKHAADELAAIEFLNKQVTKESKTVQNTVAYQKLKLTAAFARNGFPQAHSKALARKIDNYTLDPQYLNPPPEARQPQALLQVQRLRRAAHRAHARDRCGYGVGV